MGNLFVTNPSNGNGGSDRLGWGDAIYSVDNRDGGSGGGSYNEGNGDGFSPGDDGPGPNGLWEVLLRILRKFGISLATCLFLAVAVFSVRSRSKCAFLQKLKEPTGSVGLILNQESDNSEQIRYDGMEEPEKKSLSPRYVESERMNQTELGKFLEEIKQKRIVRTGVPDESDFWNDCWEILYYYTNLPKSPRYGTFYAGERLGWPWAKELFFENNDLETSIYRKKNTRYRSTFDPRTVWPCKDSFSQGILPLTTKCTRPLKIPPYPENWPKKRRFPVRVGQNDPWIDFSTF